METQKQFKRRFSFEFFPPKTDKGWEKLQGVRNTLAGVDPDFFSVRSSTPRPAPRKTT